MYTGRSKPATAGSSNNSSRISSVKNSSRPSTAPPSTRSTYKMSSSSSSSSHHRLSQSSAGKPYSSNNKAAVTQRTKHNGTVTQAVRRPQSAHHLSATNIPTQEKGSDVTVKVSDKAASDARASVCSRTNTDSPEVGSSSMIRPTGNNERTSVAAAERVQSTDSALTSGPSEAACSSSSSRGKAQCSAAGPHSAVISADQAGVGIRSSRFEFDCRPTASRRVLDNDDGDEVDDARKHSTADTGLMCPHDVITRRHVTDDVGDSCSDVTAMANKWRKSPDPFYDDNDDVTAAETAESADDDAPSLRRRNCVLNELLSTKKLELEETRQRFRACTAGLEDEVEKLRREKDRLLDRLQLPEDERCSLLLDQQTLHELSARLSQSEARNEQLTSDNVELTRELRDAELAMHELHDQFQADEGVELRQLQRELDNTARDCRLLHFKVYEKCLYCLPVSSPVLDVRLCFKLNISKWDNFSWLKTNICQRNKLRNESLRCYMIQYRNV